jgi:hypothetical protein
MSTSATSIDLVDSLGSVGAQWEHADRRHLPRLAQC